MTRPLKKEIISIPGFRFSGIAAGIKKTGAKDLALIFSEVPSVVAGMFTTNKVKAAPVKISIRQIKSRKGQAIIINSGNANACTGKQGDRDAVTTRRKTADELGIPHEYVYVSSTGVIGQIMPMEKVTKAIPELVSALSTDTFDHTASAIITTDAFTKTCCRKIKIGKKTATIAGIAKGAGMICPDMATMLCYIMTDIAVNPSALDAALKSSVKKSFNRLMVDNDMSTNDTVIVMANGILQNSPFTRQSPDYYRFEKVLSEVAYDLAKMIAKDGEGATKTVEIIVNGARTEPDAEKIAKSVAGSMLVRTAIYGRDPNWGRIMAAIGYSGASIIEENISIFINKIKIVSKGVGTSRDRAASAALAENEIEIRIDLGAGTKSAKYLTCDLNENYIRINSHYRT